MPDIDIEIVLAIATVVISVVVFVSERMQTTAQVKPHLNVFCGSHRNQVYVRIGNCGMGPGVITRIKVARKAFSGEPSVVIVDLGIDDIGKNDPPLSLAHYVYGELRNNGLVDKHLPFCEYIPFDSLLDRAVPVEDSLMLLRFKDKDPEMCDAVRDVIGRLVISVEYKDTFGNVVKTPCARDCSWMLETKLSNEGPILVLEN